MNRTELTELGPVCYSVSVFTLFSCIEPRNGLPGDVSESPRAQASSKNDQTCDSIGIVTGRVILLHDS